MNLRHAALIATLIVVTAGLAMVAPAFLRKPPAEPERRVMLAFSVGGSPEAVEWSRQLGRILDGEGIGASVFVSGLTAEQYPEIFSFFGDRVDIGSQTYSEVDLTRIQDYSVKLREVENGRLAVDAAAGLQSRMFLAPFGATDQDIYSLLTRSGILADFSYDKQFNVFRDGQFIKVDAAVYEARDYPPAFLEASLAAGTPMIVLFDTHDSLADVTNTVASLAARGVRFVNASQLTGIDLTTRGERTWRP